MNLTKNPLFYLSIILTIIVGVQTWTLVQAAYQNPTSAFPTDDVIVPVETRDIVQTKHEKLSFGPAGAFISIGPGGLCLDNEGSEGCATTWGTAYGFIAGTKGDPGDPGDPGPKGDTGDTGDTGPKGDTGDTGDTGDEGDPGGKGDPGDTGPAAIIGYTAINGSAPDTDYPTGVSYGWHDPNYSDFAMGWGTYLSVNDIRSDNRFFQIDVDAHGNSAYLRAYKDGWGSWRKFVLEDASGNVNIAGNLTIDGKGIPEGLGEVTKTGACSDSYPLPVPPVCDAGTAHLRYSYTYCCNQTCTGNLFFYERYCAILMD